MVFQVLKYLLAGLFVWFAGSLFFGSSTSFVSRSTAAELVVLDVQTQKKTDRTKMYRPVFALASDETPGQGYAGNIWTRIPPHAVGDVVPGRYDADTGEMRSDQMLGKSAWLGRIARILGVLIGLQAVALIYGIPEDRLPIRVRLRSRHRRHRRRIAW